MVSCFHYLAKALADSALSDSVLNAKAQTLKARNGMARIVVTLIDSVQIVVTRSAKVGHCCLVVMVLQVHFAVLRCAVVHCVAVAARCAVLHCAVVHFVVVAAHFFVVPIQPVKAPHCVVAAPTVASKSTHFVVRVAPARFARDCGLVGLPNRNSRVTQPLKADRRRSQPDDVPDVARRHRCLRQMKESAPVG